MKKVTFFLLWCFMLSLGSIQAQSDDFLGTDLPSTSSDESGPWYYIQVVGTDDARKAGVFTLEKQEDESLAVFNRQISSESHDAIDHQLWRFEEGFNDGCFYIINKKYPDLYLVQKSWESRNGKGYLSLDEDAVEWELKERNDGGGFYHIIATDPLDTSNPSTHMGNSGWDFRVIFEGDSYGYGLNSQYRFKEYEDEGLTTSTKSLDFQYRQSNKTEDSEAGYLKSLEILGFASLIEDIKYELIDEAGVFIEVPASWDKREGGSLDIFFLPPFETQKPTEYKGIIRVSGKTAEGEISIDVELKGTAMPLMPFKTSAAVTPGAGDNWYFLQFSGRSGGYLQDLGADSAEDMNLVSTPLTDKEDASFQWKFVNIDGRNFKLVSKLGNQLEWEPETYVEDPEAESGQKKVSGFFYTKATSDNTFNFTVRPGDGAYQIKWNEATKSDGESDSIAYLNKSNQNDGFVHYTSLADIGSLIDYYTADQVSLSKVLEFSDDDKEVWYYMVFNRVLGKNKNYGVKSNGLGAITQDSILKDDTSFQWKLVGNAESCRIVDKDGYEFGGKGGTEEAPADDYSKILVDSGEGNDYKVERYGQGFNRTYGLQTWQFLNLAEGREGKYINDYGGTTTATGEYSKDSGSELIFIKVEDYFYLDIEDINPADATDGEVVSKTYYSLQGIQFASVPAEGGIFIVKTTYASNKVVTEKMFFPAQDRK